MPQASIGTLMTRGGVHRLAAPGSALDYDASAHGSAGGAGRATAAVSLVLERAVDLLDLAQGTDKPGLLAALLDREAMNSTAVGRGIAFPHPRTPLLRDEADERVAVFFLDPPVEYGALDRTPVSVLFLILSASSKNHLATLSRLSYLCRMDDFRALLAERPAQSRLLAFVEDVERSWENG